MILLSYILVGLGAFVFMEMVAWFTHKYIMHGFLWSLHKDHHRKDEGHFFEKNDFFFVIFALPGMLLFLLGTLQHLPYLIAIATGITLYGATYFLVHDVFVHQRFRWLRNSDNVYLRALRRAHKMHHKHIGKEKGECFGMLFFPVRFLKDAFSKEKSYS
ncbi:sterol desaturase family protein [Chitinophaga pinensis]|uniref:Beta-carotene hydroxylase n=1 Tax=Chitinophaga pinensis TaxID=79329 RepID=A0A5C6LRD5_9BACT|nr:sterol desaturase family protein [Chitinophaga pinensis]TWV99136.1 beta-carotene hydroxylase [Chitinophaga pinensis]